MNSPLKKLAVIAATRSLGQEKYTVVFSFATHWTDDENYRVSIEDHLLKIYGLMATGGRLIFETHCSDVGNEDFYKAMEKMRTYFEWDGFRTTDKGERELYVMKAKPVS